MVPAALAVSTVVVVAVLLVVARRLLPGDASRHQEAATAIFSMVGILHAVVLGFVLIIVWENDGQARVDSQAEANAVARIYFTARSLPEPQRSELMHLAQQYAATVARQEWPLMAQGRTSSPARQHVAGLRLTTHELRPATADQEILMASTLDAIDELVDARRDRTSALISPLTSPMWAVLIVSSALTVGFMLLFNQSGYTLHLLMVGPVAALLVFVLWLIRDLSQPFSGTSAVGPDAFEQILQRFAEFPPDGQP